MTDLTRKYHLKPGDRGWAITHVIYKPRDADGKQKRIDRTIYAASIEDAVGYILNEEAAKPRTYTPDVEARQAVME